MVIQSHQLSWGNGTCAITETAGAVKFITWYPEWSQWPNHWISNIEGIWTCIYIICELSCFDIQPIFTTTKTLIILLLPYVYSYLSSPPCYERDLTSKLPILLVWIKKNPTNKNTKNAVSKWWVSWISRFQLRPSMFSRDRKAPWVDVKPMDLWVP